MGKLRVIMAVLRGESVMYKIYVAYTDKVGFGYHKADRGLFQGCHFHQTDTLPKNVEITFERR
jgi:hypothetical protein